MDNDLFIGFVLDRYSPEELFEVLRLTTNDLVDKCYEEILDNPYLWNDFTNDPTRNEQDSREAETSGPAQEPHCEGFEVA